MRLCSDQVTDIHRCLKDLFQSIPYELFLYGSRVHDQLKGGDIDLLVLTNQQGVQVFEDNNLQLLVDLKKQRSIGARRIDVKSVTEVGLNTDPFYQSISKNMVKLSG